MTMQPANLEFDEGEGQKTLIHLISGPNAGGELTLSPGRYAVGQGDECDIVLLDPAVADIHVALTVSEDGTAVEIEPLADRVACSEGWVSPGDTSTLRIPFAIAVGNTGMAIGSAGEDWTAFEVPRPIEGPDPAPETEKPEDSDDPAPASADESPAPSDAPAADVTAEKPAADTTPDPQPEAKRETESAAAKPARAKRGKGALILVLACITVGCAVWFAFFQQSTADDIQDVTEVAAPIDAMAVANKVVRDMGLLEVSVTPGTEGGVILEGFVPDAAANNTFESILGESGVVFVNRVREVEKLLSGIQLAISGFNFPEADFGDHLDVTYLGNGVASVDGYLGPEVDRSVLRRRILGDVPGLAGVEFTRALLADWQGILEKSLSDAGLGLWLTVTQDQGTLAVSGEVTDPEAKTWRSVGKAFVEESRGWPKLTIRVVAAAPIETPEPTVVEEPEIAKEPEALVFTPPPVVEAPPPITRPNIEIIGIISGDANKSRAFLSDGEVLAVGDTFGDGFLVEAITLYQVVLQKGGEQFTFKLRHVK